MADSGHSTATLRLKVGDLAIAHPLTVPNAAVPATAVLPALQGLVNEVVGAAEAGLADQQAISCRKGCGACCRQLVPISRTEGEALLALVEAMPKERRKAVRARFAAAEAAIGGAGLAERGGRSDREMSVAYFALGVPCPFLEEESCSIHPDRPLVCREYLVTSPRRALRRADAGRRDAGAGAESSRSPRGGCRTSRTTWFPLAMLMAWSRTRPGGGKRRPGTEWVQRFLKGLTSLKT